MAKFLKSIFAPSEKKRFSRYEGDMEGDKEFTPPLDDRRKLSISRSGRMKQANKKRHSLTLDVFGEYNHTLEKPKSLEYHVHNKVISSPEPKNSRKNGADNNTKEKNNNKEQIPESKNLQGIEEIKTPEEEIENAFEIIDKVL